MHNSWANLKISLIMSTIHTTKNISRRFLNMLTNLIGRYFHITYLSGQDRALEWSFNYEEDGFLVSLLLEATAPLIVPLLLADY